MAADRDGGGTGVCFLAIPVTAQAAESETIAEGVYIGSIYVGGMTREEAADAVDTYVQEADSAELTLSVGGKSVEVTGEELGVSFSDMSIIDAALDVGRSGNLIKRYKDKKDLEHGNKVIELRSLRRPCQGYGGIGQRNRRSWIRRRLTTVWTAKMASFVFVPGEQGIVVNVKESAAAITSFVREEWDGAAAEIPLVAKISEPRGERRSCLSLRICWAATAQIIRIPMQTAVRILRLRRS